MEGEFDCAKGGGESTIEWEIERERGGKGEGEKARVCGSFTHRDATTPFIPSMLATISHSASS
jgi:hypothetical protein